MLRQNPFLGGGEEENNPSGKAPAAAAAALQSPCTAEALSTGPEVGWLSCR